MRVRLRMLLRVLPPEPERAALLEAAYSKAVAEVRDAARARNVTPALPDRQEEGFASALFLAYGRLGQLENLQYRAVLYWTRVVYGLLSLPFVVFTLPFMFQALTHSRPTGYDGRGRCVRLLAAHERVHAEPLAYRWRDVFNVLCCKPCLNRLASWIASWKSKAPNDAPEEPSGRSKELWSILRANWRRVKAVTTSHRRRWKEAGDFVKNQNQQLKAEALV